MAGVLPRGRRGARCLNGVRPRRPEQSVFWVLKGVYWFAVSMESGLEDRNNMAVSMERLAGVVSQWSPA